MITGATIVKALGGHWRGRQGMCRCPAHDDKNPSMHVTELRDGKILVKCFSGCENRSVIDALKGRGLWPEHEKEFQPRSVRPIQPRPEISDDEIMRSMAAVEIWRKAVPATGTLAETYLRSRAIDSPIPPSIRFAWLKHGPSGLTLPALIGAVQDSRRQIVSVQRIFLTMDGGRKAEVTNAKMTLGPMLDGAVRLAPAGRVLGIAEGIETALSAMALFYLPVWACLGCHRMGAIGLPEIVEHIVLFADNGEAGMKAAEKAADQYRAQGLDVSIESPESEKDFNDVAQRRNKRAA